MLLDLSAAFVMNRLVMLLDLKACSCDDKGQPLLCCIDLSQLLVMNKGQDVARSQCSFCDEQATIVMLLDLQLNKGQPLLCC